jgi:hypothetical protein
MRDECQIAKREVRKLTLTKTGGHVDGLSTSLSGPSLTLQHAEGLHGLDKCVSIRQKSFDKPHASVGWAADPVCSWLCVLRSVLTFQSGVWPWQSAGRLSARHAHWNTHSHCATLRSSDFGKLSHLRDVSRAQVFDQLARRWGNKRCASLGISLPRVTAALCGISCKLVGVGLVLRKIALRVVLCGAVCMPSMWLCVAP